MQLGRELLVILWAEWQGEATWGGLRSGGFGVKCCRGTLQQSGSAQKQLLAERGSAWPQQQPGGQGGQPLLSHSRARSLTRLAVMKCDRGKSNVCIYSLLNYSGLSAEAHRLFSLLMRASLLGAVTVAFANFTHAHTHAQAPPGRQALLVSA